MSRPTPDDARSAYQSKVPGRQEAFRRTIRGLKEECARGDCLFSKYIFRVADAAKDEMRERNRLAAECVKALIDAGWVPANRNEVASVFSNCFSAPRSASHESFADLKDAVDIAYADIGNNGPDIRRRFRLELGEVQVLAHDEAVAQLWLHRPIQGGNGPAFYGAVGAVQIGAGNAAYLSRGEGPKLRAMIQHVTTLRNAPSVVSVVASVLAINEGNMKAVTRGWKLFIRHDGRDYEAQATTLPVIDTSGIMFPKREGLEGRQVDAFSQESGLVWGTFVDLPEDVPESSIRVRFVDGSGQHHET